MSETEKKLRESQYFYNQMLENYAEPEKFEFNLQAFLSAARSVTFVMQKEYSKKPNFEEWYELKRKEMQADEMLRFFHKARTVSIHEKPVSLGTMAHIRRIYIHSVPQGWGFAITAKGEPVWITPKGERVHASEFDKEVTRVYLFNNPPKTFLGVDLKDFSVVHLCRLHLAYLTDLAKQVHEKIGET